MVISVAADVLSACVHPHRAQDIESVHKPSLNRGLLSETGSASV